MISQSFKDSVLADIAEKMDMLAGTLVNGRCQNYEQYCRVSGELLGYQRASDLIQERYRAMFETPKKDAAA